MPEDHNTHQIGDLIKAFFRKKGIDKRLEQVDLRQQWEEVAGKMIANHTDSLNLKDGVLTLKLNSAALRHTLSFSKSELIDTVNKHYNKTVVEKIELR